MRFILFLKSIMCFVLLMTQIGCRKFTWYVILFENHFCWGLAIKRPVVTKRLFSWRVQWYTIHECWSSGKEGKGNFKKRKLKKKRTGRIKGRLVEQNLSIKKCGLFYNCVLNHHLYVSDPIGVVQFCLECSMSVWNYLLGIYNMKPRVLHSFPELTSLSHSHNLLCILH